jgi:N-acetylglucosamine-6-sulfatase
MRRPLSRILAASLPVFLLASSSMAVLPEPRQPNIVVIMLDDQRWDALDATHAADPLHPELVMPVVVSQLAERGVTFTRSFVSTALCAPSRASFFTGQYAHTHGVHTTSLDSFQAQRAVEARLLPVWLKNAGYRTGLYGKYSNRYREFTRENPAYVPPGWQEWHALEGQGQYFNFPLWEGTEGRAPVRSIPGGYSTDVLRDRAVQFIRQSVSEHRPFFLYFAPKAVHGVGESGLPEPAPEDSDRFADAAPWRPADTYNEAATCDKPVWLRDGMPPLGPAAERHIAIRRQRALETSQAVDRAVQAILDELRATPGVDENTVIVYTGDNGYFWGEHRLLAKEAPYEEAIRVPLVIRPAGGVAPRRDDSLVLNIDLAPTIAELAGARPLLSPDGRSLAPLLRRDVHIEQTWRTDALIEHWEDGDGIPTFAGIRLANRKYVEYANGEKELYKLASDPKELTNVAEDPVNAAILPNLSARLRALYPGWPPAEPQQLIFASGFECGDLSAWSASTTGGGDLAVALEAAMDGSGRGLKVVVDDMEPLSVQDDGPNNDGRYKARFSFDPHTFDPGLAAGNEIHLFFAAEENPVRRLAAVLLQRTSGGGYTLTARVRLDDDSLVEAGPIPITRTPHVVELDWAKASADGASDGSLRFSVRATSAPTPTTITLAGLDNDVHTVDFIRLGAIGVKPGASGTFYLDTFVSRR